jgi:hypothetical protein
VSTHLGQLLHACFTPVLRRERLPSFAAPTMVQYIDAPSMFTSAVPVRLLDTIEVEETDIQIKSERSSVGRAELDFLHQVAHQLCGARSRERRAGLRQPRISPSPPP